MNRSLNVKEVGGFKQHRMNAFHTYFGNGLGISTIFGAMTYSSNRNVGPVFGPEEPMEAETVEIMLLGNIPEKEAERVHKILSHKNTSDGVNGPYSDVTIGEWLAVANILTTPPRAREAGGECND